jgi:hypothetical protein
MSHSAARVLLVLFAAWISACSDPEPVPFGLDRHPLPTTATDPAPPALPTVALRAYPAPSPSQIIAGASFSGAAPDGTARDVRASYARDLDGDGDDDAIVLLANAAQEVDVVHASREGDVFTPTALTHIALPLPGCLLDSLAFDALDPRLALATVRWSCANTNGGEDAQAHVLLEVGRTPRVIERFGYVGAEGDGVTFVAADRDDDGNPDLLVEASVGDARATLTFRSTASGMARESGALEAAIAQLADEARAAIRRNPETALTKADAALGLYRALCAESETPRLTLGSSRGIPCGNSVGALRARAVLVAAHARAGHVLEALTYAEALRGVRLREAERRLADDALATLTASTPEAHVSVDAHPLDERSVRRSSIAFADDDHVLLLGSTPQNVSLADGVAVPGFPIDTRIVDPSGRLVLRAIERRCDGTVLVVAPLSSSSMDGPVLDGHTALFSPRPTPVGVACPDMTAALRADDGGYVPLGWAPQGVLVARLGELMLVPLDLRGELAGSASVLPLDAPAPAPVVPGAASSDVSHYALLTDYGILVMHRGSEGASVLVRPTGFARQGTAIDVAISPSGRRVAWMQEDHLRWADL